MKFFSKKTADTIESRNSTVDIPAAYNIGNKIKVKRSDKPKSIPVGKKIRFSYPRKSRFTLLVGDEGAILLYMKSNVVLSRQFVSDASSGNLDELRETINKDRMAPITLVIDSVDQSFVQQTLPPVSSFSVNKLIKRRLDRDFKPEDIKGAIVLGKDKEGRKDWSFLMISVEKSPQIMEWLDFVMTFENRFRGIVLLSVEAAIVIKNLERSLGISGKSGTSSEWKILVTHNKVGGFRQIILRNDRLIFTRLAQPVGEPMPEVIAGHIEQEMTSTIEYLKRFGFNPRSGLDVYIIASESTCKAIDPNRFDAAHFSALSPHSISQNLGLRGATQPEDQFGDVVMAAAVGSIRKNVLKLTTVESRLFDKFQLIKYSQRLFGTFAALGILVYGAYAGYNTLKFMSDLEDAEQKRRLGQQSLDTLMKKIEDSKIDIGMVGDQLDVYRQIKSVSRGPNAFLMEIANAVKLPVTIKAINWNLGDKLQEIKAMPGFASYNLQPGAQLPERPKPENSSGRNIPIPIEDMVTAVVKVEFPAGLKSPELFKKFSEDFLKSLNEAMPYYAIAYTLIPAEYLDIRGLQMNFDKELENEGLGSTPILIEVSIRGKMLTSVEGINAP